jgi:hypothetical protein
MSLIGMLESFFILSLGITFVLVLFLVYHFKQRLAILENKCDTTFEIINNVVSELGNIRGAFRVGGATTQMPAPAPPVRPENAKINVTISDDDREVSDYDDEDSSDDDDDDDDDGDDGDDEEDDDDDDDDEDDDDDDEDDEDQESNDDNAAHHVVHDVAESGDDDSDGVGHGVHDVNESGEEDVNITNTIRIINLDNQQEFDIIETVEELTAENGNRDDHVDDESSHIENMEEIQLHVEKLPTGERHLDDSSIASSVAESKNNSHIYKKMTLPVLKAYVIEKGLASDPSKMKKQELIQLIESSDI